MSRVKRYFESQGDCPAAHEVFGSFVAKTRDGKNIVVEDRRGHLYCWLFNRIEHRRGKGAWREQAINDNPRPPFKLRKYLFRAREVVGKVVSCRGKEFVLSQGAGSIFIRSKKENEIELKAWGVTITLFVRTKSSQTEWYGYKKALERAHKLLGKVSTERFVCR